VRLSEEAHETALKRALKEFLEQTPKLFREHLGETMDTKEKEEMMSSPVKHLGKVEAMLVMKRCKYDLLKQGDKVNDIMWVRAETRVVHGKLLQQARYYHSRRAKKGQGFPFSKLPVDPEFKPYKLYGGLCAYALLTGNPGIGKTIKMENLVFLVLNLGIDLGLVVGRGFAMILSHDLRKCKVFTKLDGDVWLKLNQLPLVLGECNNMRDNDFCMWLCTHIDGGTFLIIDHSPRKNAVEKYMDEAMVCYLSTCSLQEIRGMNELWGNEIDVATLYERYRKFGGAPRWVLGHEYTLERRESKMEEQFKAHVELDQDFTKSLNKYSHAIVDMQAEAPDFLKCVTRWRPYTFGLLSQERKWNQILLLKNEAFKYLQNGNPVLAGLKFEALCGSILQAGASLPTRIEQDGKLHCSSISFPGEMGIAELDWWPIKRSVMDTNYRDPCFPCVDFAVLAPDAKTLHVFDVTVSKPTFNTMGNLGNAKKLVKYQGNIKHFADMIRKLGVMKIPDDFKLVYVYLVPANVLEKVVWRWEKLDVSKDSAPLANHVLDVTSLAKKDVETALEMRWMLRGNKSKSLKKKKELLMKHAADYKIINALYERKELLAVGIPISKSDGEFRRSLQI